MSVIYKFKTIIKPVNSVFVSSYRNKQSKLFKYYSINYNFAKLHLNLNNKQPHIVLMTNFNLEVDHQ